MEEKLKINLDFSKIQDPFVEVYDPEDNLVIKTNDDKIFLYICCQIKDAKAEGYYVVVPDEIEKVRKKDPNAEIIKHPITPYGKVKLNGCQMFHVYGELLRKLI